MFPQWGTAVWDVDRWPALTVEALLQQAPDPDRGVPIGVADWRLSVEALLPSDELAIWGVGEWDVATWNTLVWHDLTPWVRGLEWSRGSDEPFGRARVGTLTVTLDDRDNRWSPWNPNPPTGSASFFGPGTVIRVGVRSGTDTRAGGWLPQITCVVDNWSPTYVAANLADRYVDVTANETLRDLAMIDDNALPGLVGGGESPIARLPRLLDAAGWRYGLKIEAQHVLANPGSYPLQSTDMANNRLAECYLVADSVDAIFRTDKTGCALLTNPEYIGTVGPADTAVIRLSAFSWGNGANRSPFIGFDLHSTHNVGASWDFQNVTYNPDSFASAPSDSAVRNDIRFARAGGTQQVHEQQASIGRYGRRTYVRNDFICNNDPLVLQNAFYTSIRRGLTNLRVTNVTVNTVDRGDADALAVLAADYYDECQVWPPDAGEHYPLNPRIGARIASIHHRVTPRSPGETVSWETSFGFDTRNVYDLPGAQLPSTPL